MRTPTPLTSSRMCPASPVCCWGRFLRRGGGEADLFPGLVSLTCALAAMAAVRRRARGGERPHRSWLRLYSALALLGVVASLGPRRLTMAACCFRIPVFTWVAAFVPGFAQLRAPARFAVMASSRCRCSPRWAWRLCWAVPSWGGDREPWPPVS